MNSPQSIQYKFESLRSIAFGDITGSYTAVGSPTEHSSIQYKIQNLTDANIIYSTDGINDHDVQPASSGFVDDVCSNKALGSGAFLPQGTQFYVKSESSDPTTGTVYITVSYLYGPNS